MKPCQYANIFGKPGEGVHKFRILGVAAVDLILTVILAILLAKWMKWNIILVFVSLMILSVIVHKFFCVQTTLTKKIFA